MLSTTYLTAALLGLLATAWRQLRVLASQASGLAIVRASLATDLGQAIESYCAANLRRSPFGPRSYGTTGDYVRPLGRWTTVAFERVGNDTVIFWRGWWPVVLTGVTNPNTIGQRDPTISFVRGTFDLDRLILDSLAWDRGDDKPEESPSRFRVTRHGGERRIRGGSAGHSTGDDGPGSPPQPYTGNTGPHRGSRIVGYTWDDLGMPQLPEGHHFDRLALNGDARAMIRDARRWKLSESWHRDRGVPWRLGWTLHGDPGNGKTSLVRAIAMDLEVPVHVFDLSTMDNRDFQSAWDQVRGDSPCLVLIEDVDGVFHGRDNVSGGGLTFDCLLNGIDGVDPSEGVFLVVTTNRIDLLDPALGVPAGDDPTRSTRPGRIDRVLRLGPPDEDGRRKIAGRILRDCPDRIEWIVEEGAGDSGAQFQDRCAREALDRFWGLGQDRAIDAFPEDALILS